jgi:hypothetical protein
MYCLQIDHSTPIAAPSAQGPVAFVSSDLFTPTNTGIDAADTLCQTEATSAGLTGQFLAFLATTSEAAISRFNPGGSWVRRDGVVTTSDFMTWLAPIDVTIDRQYVDAIVFSGAVAPTVKSATPAESCDDWTNAAGNNPQLGRAGIAGPEAFGGYQGSCSARRILCLEQR